MAEQLLPSSGMTNLADTTISGVDDSSDIPTNTFVFDLRKGILVGQNDGKQALEQAIYLIIYTERYKWLIHDYNYGVKLSDLYGKPFTFVIPIIQDRITNAILADNRFTAVNNMTFKEGTTKNSLLCSFTVVSNIDGISDEITINDFQIDYNR